MKNEKGANIRAREITQMKNKNLVGQTFLSDNNSQKTKRTDKNVCSTGDEESGLNIRRRKLPHWTLRGATYFITFRLQKGELSVEEQKLTLKHIKEGNGRFYNLIATVVMPDHVHLLLTPVGDYSLSRIMKGIKGVSAWKINLRRRRTDKNVCSTATKKNAWSIWKDESFDRVIRNQKEFDEKLDYMFYNPMKEGLTEDPWNYYGWYFNET